MVIVIDCFKLVKGAGKSIGIYNLAHNLVMNLVKENSNNYKLVVLGTDKNANDFNIEGVEFVSLPYNPLNKIFCVWWELVKVPFVAKKYKADRVIFPRGFAPLFHPVKDRIIVHDLIPFYYHEHYPDFFNKMENAYIMWRLKASIKGCDKVITISEASKQDILRYAKISENKIAVIHNGCNKMQKVSVEKKDYICAITSGLPHKNAKGIIESYDAYFQKAENPLPIKIVGISDAENYNISCEVKEKIQCYKMIPSDQELHELIAGARVFLFLSLAEGFGFPPLEAMQLGTSVICSNLTSLPEVVGSAALLVNPEKAEEVADAIIQLSQDRELQKNLIAEGHSNVTRFSWNDIARRYWKEIV